MRPIAFILQLNRSFPATGKFSKLRGVFLHVFPVVFFLLSLFTVHAQYEVVNIPALKQKIREAKTDSTRARLYNILGWELRFADHKESERLADEAIRISTSDTDHLRLAEAYKIKGFARVIEQKMPECLRMYTIALAHAEKAGNGYLLAYITGLIGGMYNDKGDFDKSIRYYLEAIKIAEGHHSEEMIAFLSNCVGEAYSDAGRSIAVTLPFYERAMEIEIRLQNWQYVGMICSNIAKEQMLAGNTAKAEKAASQAINYLHKKEDRAYVYATVITDIGETYAGLGKTNEAEIYLTEGLTILDSLGTKDNVLIPLSALAKVYLKQNALGKAEMLATRLLKLASAYKTKLFLRDACKILSDVAQKKQDYALALTYYQAYSKWNDSLFNENKEKSIAQVESRMKLEQKELEVKYESEKKAQENMDLKKSILGLRYKTIAVIAIAIILLTLGIELIVLNRSQRQKNKELQSQKKIIEKQSGEKDILIREINHRVKNNLQVISSLLNLQANSLTDPGAIEALRDSHKRVKAISLIHQKLYGFEDIAAIPLEEYIKALFADLKMVYAAKHVQLVTVTEPQDVRLDIVSAVPVGLILNETITNAFKYAFKDKETGTVFIEFIEKADSCQLSIRDNGKGLPEGFDPERSSSLGFRIIKELSKQLRGHFDYISDNGAVFTISFPNTSVRKKMS